MRANVEGLNLQDLYLVQGVRYKTPFQNITGNFALPDDPQPDYAFLATGAATRTITLPRIIGNLIFPTVAAINGLTVVIINQSTVAANLLQAANAAGDAGGANVGPTLAVVTGGVTTMGIYQIVNGAWIYLKSA
jgi:hypothetical protein